VLHIICYISVLNILQERYIEELNKIHEPELEGSRSVPFNLDDAYAANGGTLHERYVKISIVFC
jgi:hypothetical protein